MKEEHAARGHAGGGSTPGLDEGTPTQVTPGIRTDSFPFRPSLPFHSIHLCLFGWYPSITSESPLSLSLSLSDHSIRPSSQLYIYWIEWSSSLDRPRPAPSLAPWHHSLQSSGGCRKCCRRAVSTASAWIDGYETFCMQLHLLQGCSAAFIRGTRKNKWKRNGSSAPDRVAITMSCQGSADPMRMRTSPLPVRMGNGHSICIHRFSKDRRWYQHYGMQI